MGGVRLYRQLMSAEREELVFLRNSPTKSLWNLKWSALKHVNNTKWTLQVAYMFICLYTFKNIT